MAGPLEIIHMTIIQHKRYIRKLAWELLIFGGGWGIKGIFLLNQNIKIHLTDITSFDITVHFPNVLIHINT